MEFPAKKGSGGGKSSSAARSKYRGKEDSPSVHAVVDWADVNPEKIARAVVSVVNAGDAITFARTSDGGAYSVTVLDNGRKHFHRKPTVEEIEQELTEIAEDADYFSRHSG